jgi:hypothetical protein
MPISLALILIGIVVALIINFITNKPGSSIEEDVILPEPTPEPTTTPEPTPDPVPYPKVDPPVMEAKSIKKSNTKKPKTNK